jgi:zinc D-Ala-D-Ala carboxypeptidase
MVVMAHSALLAELGISAAALEARGLKPCPEASHVEIAEVGEEGREHLLVPVAAEAWRQLKQAALGDGVTLFIVSAYRSVERQAEIVRRKLEAGQRLEEILAVSAPPGYSEHHTGRAVDLGTPGTRPLELEFAETAAFQWLDERARDFGFVLSYPQGNAFGYDYEPWHWCYRHASRGSWPPGSGDYSTD